ncbi:hypothetical protein PGTUg99_004865 [Puccinia graminis f. sp. tritici]|uniref:Uncharacterized protein n=1 Tax=Puccinia graminis f. sp. tritici TaxID=56615 RepID=A0A5B0QYH0_PUCGR|nr:hypothetical protein PGTUg99_004865 [Puccinia graminis f. sp. tritici]
MAAHWLLEKLEYAEQVHDESTLTLARLHQVPNPHTPGSNYTNGFFDQQWRDEQAYHVNTNRSAEREQVELGRLLCLEEELNDALSSVVTTPEQALMRARTCAIVRRQLEAQQLRAQPIPEDSHLNRTQREKLTKVWYAKTELRRTFLALVEERQPMLRVCRAGESTTLGTRGQQRLTEALRKRKAKLRTTLNTYNRLAQAFIQSTPDRPAPPVIEYAALTSLQSDDTFWNDGIFTNANEPWAVDPLTQRGIRALACLNRALKEKRRLTWEVRRAMRWATQNHRRLVSLINDARVYMESREGNPPEPGVIPPTLDAIFGHLVMNSLPTQAFKIGVVAQVLQTSFQETCDLQLEWNDKLLEVFQKTSPQYGDEFLLGTWNQQLQRIKCAIDYHCLTQIPGHMNRTLSHIMNGHYQIVQIVPEGDDGDDGDDDDDEEQYLADLDHILSESLRTDLERLPVDQHDQGGH